MFDLLSLCQSAKNASKKLNELDANKINDVLNLCAKAIRDNAEFLKKENAIDVENARLKGTSEAFIDRLVLSDAVIENVATGIEQVALLTSPVGKTTYFYENEKQGIRICKNYVPFGVIGIIYESRPNVTADAFALTFKTQNAVVLKGGSDAINSNRAIVSVLRKTLKENGAPENAVCLIDDTSRETTSRFIKMNGLIDLLIPRGSANLIKNMLENATVPIIETGAGNCHIYVDEFADIDKAVKVIFNAKTQRYGVCNACESLVIHSKILDKALPLIAEKLYEKKVEIRCDERAYAVLNGKYNSVPASEEDFGTEYDDAIISVKTIDSLECAIEHINENSTKHSESIITENSENAVAFMNGIDSACVYHNSSTRFSDGFVFGLGAEIGISTQKLHARGPMGLEALVTTKFFVLGDGAVRK